jgi:DNA-binding MarR family transcriptional regulator
MSAETRPAEVSADALVELGGSFKRMTTAVRRLRGRETQRAGELSYAQYSLLFGLAEDGTLSARELAAAAELAPATVTQMLDNLAAHALVERVRSKTDKRVVLTSLTARGRELVEERRAEFEVRWREALHGLSEEELRIATDVLDRLGQMFEAVAEE